VTLELPCCFEVVHHTADLLVVGETGLARYILVANPVEIIDPSTGEPAPLPENLAAWLASHPMLDVTGPTEVTISGRKGSAVEGTPGGEAAFDVNGQLKFAQGRSSSGAPIFVGSDHRFRFTVLEGAEDPLLVGIVARADRYEEFLLTAEPIVDGIALAP
jgi:hypothetical protein